MNSENGPKSVVSYEFLSRGKPDRRESVEELDFVREAPAGFYVAARARFGFPALDRNEMPQAWIVEYDRDGLMVQDTGLRWAYANTGTVRLSEIATGPATHMERRAAWHGLHFGAVVSFCDRDDAASLTYGLFYRSDREFTDAELAALSDRVQLLHRTHGRARERVGSRVGTARLRG